ncbi:MULTISPECIES: hypothetical protein [Amycolatopsis]|uniref:Uncharacterized protein n=2 Tax=Amycolatopsis TaxID=1813 RepID=A0A1I4BYM2_9PSEU|nr:hypothetical protein [Amycolatopsis sacchari]SFK73755.1 hypothetical protein SAMN05421835_13131 [Amycolatopsis sacchari]
MDTPTETPAATPPHRPRRPGWLIGVAVVALAGLLFSVVSLRSHQDSTPAALPAEITGNPVGVALYESM